MHERAKGAEALAAMTPDKEHRAGAISALTTVYRENNILSQPAAARALAVWGDAALERVFIDRLTTGKKTERRGIFEMLAHRHTKTAVEALARRLRVPEDVAAVESHLRNLGEEAEAAVRALLPDPNKKVRQSAVEILGDIGTAESLPNLQKVALDPDAVLAARARLAIEAIKGRTK